MKQPAAARNLLVVMSDEHQARATGCAGHPFARTPNLDRLAATGVRFSAACTPSPICVPARAAFATGRYVHDIRLWDNAMPFAGQFPGWGSALQAAGVPVESVGKLHYRSAEDPAGFDAEHIPMMVAGGVGMVWASVRGENERRAPASRMLGEHIGPGESDYTRYDEAVVKKTLEWLRRRRGDRRPWCLFVGLVAPHFPLAAPERFYKMFPPESLPPPKLHPDDGYVRHPWVEKQNAFMDSESRFADARERRVAVACYHALCAWTDHNVGRVLDGLRESGFAEDTVVVYTSDHGDNAGARGLWGKSNFYEESVAVPLIVSVPGGTVPGEKAGRADGTERERTGRTGWAGVGGRGGRGGRGGSCGTPVSLLDLSETIVDHFGASLEGDRPGRSLYKIMSEPDDLSRVVFSEYHAAGAVSGAFMVRDGRWKLIDYVGFEPELFDLQNDPEETRNMAKRFPQALSRMRGKLREICDPDAVNAQALSDQAALVERFGGRDAALKIGAPGATPPPEVPGRPRPHAGAKSQAAEPKSA